MSYLWNFIFVTLSYVLIYNILIVLAEASTGPPPAPASSFEDVRCKCVCPKTNSQNGTSGRHVYISANVDPNLCKCDLVVDNPTVKKCAQCECKYESRNTTTIKVVVIFIICVLSLLLIYMMFLLCLDPIIARKPSSAGRYQEHSNEEDDQTVRQVPREEHARLAQLTRQRSIVNRVTDEQSKWKDTVSEQRRIIYERHSMLN